MKYQVHFNTAANKISVTDTGHDLSQLYISRNQINPGGNIQQIVLFTDLNWVNTTDVATSTVGNVPQLL